jgi:hypothetical protein
MSSGRLRDAGPQCRPANFAFLLGLAVVGRELQQGAGGLRRCGEEVKGKTRCGVVSSARA